MGVRSTNKRAHEYENKRRKTHRDSDNQGERPRPWIDILILAATGLKPLHLKAGGCMKRLNGTSLERRVVDSMVPKQIGVKGNRINHMSNQYDSLADLCIVGRWRLVDWP